jgi:hypothetical protein
MSDPSSSVAREAGRPDGPAYWYPGAPATPSGAPEVASGAATFRGGMDAQAVSTELGRRLGSLGIGHSVEVVRGSNADGVTVRSPYAEPVTVVEDQGRFALVARGADGAAKVIDTEIAAEAPIELLSLYLAFHTLWAMKRTVDAQGAAAVTRRMPNLLTDQQLVIAFIAGSISSADEAVRAYASGLMGTAANMLRS